MRSTLAQLREELRQVDARIDALYWAFTRTKRGVPPCVADPTIYQRRRALQDAIRARTHARRRPAT